MVDVTNSDGLRIERLEAENARLRAALAAEQAQPGWKLVPVEPTLAMLDALRADTTPFLLLRYSAMLAAAPQPAPAEQPARCPDCRTPRSCDGDGLCLEQYIQRRITGATAPAERKPLTYEQAAEAWRAWEQQPAPDHWWDVAEEHRRKAAYIAGLQDGERVHGIGV